MAVRKPRQGAVATARHAVGMEREMRLKIYEKELRRLLFDLRDHDFVVFEDSRDKERYVQFIVHDSAVLGEVGSRHWMPESSGLRRTSKYDLTQLDAVTGERASPVEVSTDGDGRFEISAPTHGHDWVAVLESKSHRSHKSNPR